MPNKTYYIKLYSFPLVHVNCTICTNSVSYSIYPVELMYTVQSASYVNNLQFVKRILIYCTYCNYSLYNSASYIYVICMYIIVWVDCPNVRPLQDLNPSHSLKVFTWCPTWCRIKFSCFTTFVYFLDGPILINFF